MCMEIREDAYTTERPTKDGTYHVRDTVWSSRMVARVYGRTVDIYYPDNTYCCTMLMPEMSPHMQWRPRREVSNVRYGGGNRGG